MRALEGGGFAAGVYEDPANLLIPPLAQPSFSCTTLQRSIWMKEKKKIVIEVDGWLDVSRVDLFFVLRYF
jgi:hypothetical protein